jgi:hypothetical protein
MKPDRLQKPAGLAPRWRIRAKLARQATGERRNVLRRFEAEAVWKRRIEKSL